jgi:DNA gyrase/topoisomerase IV subunit B
MNAEQLWETTLDPKTRTFLQVKVHDIDQAEEVFSTLIGVAVNVYNIPCSCHVVTILAIVLRI